MNYYNTFLRDDLLSLRNNVDIILVLYEKNHELIPTALEDFIEKVQELTDYVEDLPVEDYTQTRTFSCPPQTGVKSGRPSRLNNY